MIAYGRQHITQDDIDAVVAVLRSDFLTQGPAVPKFEAALAAQTGAVHAVAVNSATSALHVACLALGLRQGDHLWTVPNSFVASANCGLYCGARVDFVDIDPRTWNISIDALREKLEKARRAGTLPRIVVPVHFAGQPADQEAIWELAGEYGFKVLEDASHAIGASRNGERVGSCRWSHATVFSFHPVKIITTAEGGAVLTNDARLCADMQMLRSHGVTRDASRFVAAGDDPPAWHYEQQMLGFNYRMTDVQAALGSSQLTRLCEYVEARNRLARRYDGLLDGLPLSRPTLAPGNVSAWHLYVVRVSHGRRSCFDGLRQAGIGVNVHYAPIHLQPYYRALGFSRGDFPEAERHGDEAITLPLHPGLDSRDQDRVIRVLRELLAR
ncbi:MAG: UDP-4-amino-4,6-dideoxy-N-acetyl-beta-L-altrosamine transaminase [Betaproteobacteria bacterium]|nr:UDP-4-amino-4,6-dideoxy-N-acetyl-beta-L-altrosamine transaminase [Betaproteobacteria bacterium]